MTTVKNYIPMDVIERANKKAQKNEWHMIDIRFLTNHPADNYLFVTLCYIPSKKEYVTSLYNNDCQGFFEGYYTKSKMSAYEKFDNKR